MKAAEVLKKLAAVADPQTKKTLLRHGAQEPLFGVKIGELKKIQKAIKVDHALALELFDTGNYDAMHLAGLIAEPARMTKKDLQHWIEKASSAAIADYTVAGVAADSPHGFELATRWIDSPKELIAAAGWSTLAGLAATKSDEELPVKDFRRLVNQIEKQIHNAPNKIRYTMNSFIIAVGGSIVSLSDEAIASAKRIGEVTVDMGDTACKVPDAVSYIEKIKKMGRLGKKKASARC